MQFPTGSGQATPLTADDCTMYILHAPQEIARLANQVAGNDVGDLRTGNTKRRALKFQYPWGKFREKRTFEDHQPRNNRNRRYNPPTRSRFIPSGSSWRTSEHPPIVERATAIRAGDDPTIATGAASHSASGRNGYGSKTRGTVAVDPADRVCVLPSPA